MPFQSIKDNQSGLRDLRTAIDKQGQMFNEKIQSQYGNFHLRRCGETLERVLHD